jgi:hypothetical protein
LSGQSLVLKPPCVAPTPSPFSSTLTTNVHHLTPYCAMQLGVHVNLHEMLGSEWEPRSEDEASDLGSTEQPEDPARVQPRQPASPKVGCPGHT